MSAQVTGNGTGATSFTYDGNGNVKTRTQYTDSAATIGLTTQYNYDSSGNLTSAIDPNNNTVTYAHNDGCTPSAYVSQITDPLNHITKQT